MDTLHEHAFSHNRAGCKMQCVYDKHTTFFSLDDCYKGFTSNDEELEFARAECAKLIENRTLTPFFKHYLACESISLLILKLADSPLFLAANHQGHMNFLAYAEAYRLSFAVSGAGLHVQNLRRLEEIMQQNPYTSRPFLQPDTDRLSEFRLGSAALPAQRSCPDEQDLPSAVAELLHPDYAGPYEAEINATLLDPAAASTQAYRFDHQRHPTTGTASDPVPVQANGGGHASAHDKGRVSPAAGGDTESEGDDETGAGVETGNGLDAGAGTGAGTGGISEQANLKARTNDRQDRSHTPSSDNVNEDPIVLPFDEIAHGANVTCMIIDDLQYLVAWDVVSGCMHRLAKDKVKTGVITTKCNTILSDNRDKLNHLHALKAIHLPGIP